MPGDNIDNSTRIIVGGIRRECKAGVDLKQPSKKAADWKNDKATFDAELVQVCKHLHRIGQNVSGLPAWRWSVILEDYDCKLLNNKIQAIKKRGVCYHFLLICIVSDSSVCVCFR